MGKRFDPETAYRLIMECYKSGLTTRQWLYENGMSHTTFYNWVRRLRDTACYNLPPETPTSPADTPAIPAKQDVVRVDVVPDGQDTDIVPPVPCPASGRRPGELAADAPIIVRLAGADILVGGHADPAMLGHIIRSLRGTPC